MKEVGRCRSVGWSSVAPFEFRLYLNRRQVKRRPLIQEKTNWFIWARCPVAAVQVRSLLSVDDLRVVFLSIMTVYTTHVTLFEVTRGVVVAQVETSRTTVTKDPGLNLHWELGFVSSSSTPFLSFIGVVSLISPPGAPKRVRLFSCWDTFTARGKTAQYAQNVSVTNESVFKVLQAVSA